jgi:hypothetical protein
MHHCFLLFLCLNYVLQYYLAPSEVSFKIAIRPMLKPSKNIDTSSLDGCKLWYVGKDNHKNGVGIIVDKNLKIKLLLKESVIDLS